MKRGAFKNSPLKPWFKAH